MRATRSSRITLAAVGSSPPPSSCAGCGAAPLLMPAAVIRSIRAVTAASAVTAPASMHTKSVLAAVALVVTILRGDSAVADRRR